MSTQQPGSTIHATVGDDAHNLAVGGTVTQTIHQHYYAGQKAAVDVAAAEAALARLPLDAIPPIAPLPPGSRMPFGVNPLFIGRETDLKTLAAGLKGGETVAVGQIAGQLGDLPLALHLAGSFLARYRHVVSPAAYLAQLQAPDLLKHRSLQGGDFSPTGHVQHVARTFALSYERLDPEGEVDALALGLLARAARFAPGELIPRGLLLASMALAEDEEAALQAEDALHLLANLGLLEMDAHGDVLLHRLVVRFVQAADAALSQAAQAAVAAALLDEANRLNNAGVPGPLLAWQGHLRYVTDTLKDQASEQAGGLCNTLGFHLQMVGEYAAARPYYERALAIRQEVLGDKHPDTAASLWWMAHIAQAEGDLAGARGYYERALAIFRARLGAEHPYTRGVQNALAALDR
jgi:hypothetical protein